MANREYRGDHTYHGYHHYIPEDTILWIPVPPVIHTMGYRGYTILWIPVLQDIHTMGWSTREYHYPYHQYYQYYYQYYQ